MAIMRGIKLIEAIQSFNSGNIVSELIKQKMNWSYDCQHICVYWLYSGDTVVEGGSFIIGRVVGYAV